MMAKYLGLCGICGDEFTKGDQVVVAYRATYEGMTPPENEQEERDLVDGFVVGVPIFSIEEYGSARDYGFSIEESAYCTGCWKSIALK
jgi:hypothetical protein